MFEPAAVAAGAVIGPPPTYVGPDRPQVKLTPRGRSLAALLRTRSVLRSLASCGVTAEDLRKSGGQVMFDVADAGRGSRGVWPAGGCDEDGPSVCEPHVRYGGVSGGPVVCAGRLGRGGPGWDGAGRYAVFRRAGGQSC